MSSIWAPELYRMASDIRMAAGPWPSDEAVRRIEVLQWSARDLITLDRKRPAQPSLRRRSAEAFLRKKRPTRGGRRV